MVANIDCKGVGEKGEAATTSSASIGSTATTTAHSVGSATTGAEPAATAAT
jgi:hypothetical protein